MRFVSALTPRSPRRSTNDGEKISYDTARGTYNQQMLKVSRFSENGVEGLELS